GEEHAHGDDLVDRLAVLDRVRARRVVRDHAADVGAVGRGDVRRELQAVGGEEAVELVAHHAGLHPHPALLQVQLEDARQVLGDVDDQRLSHGLAGQRRAAAAGEDRRAVPRGGAHGGADVVLVERHHDADRRDAVGAGTGGAGGAGLGVEAHLALDRGPQVALEGAGVDGGGDGQGGAEGAGGRREGGGGVWRVWHAAG